MAKGTICPLQNLGKKTQKEAHTKRFTSVQKLQAKTEHGKFQSCSEHVRLMLNQAWWRRLAIVNMLHRKRVRTLENFFAPNQNQCESEKNDTEEVQCINQEETDKDQRKPKKSRDHTWLRYERRRCSAIFVGNLRRQTPLHQQKGVQISVPLKIKMSLKILASGEKLSPSDQILAQTLSIIWNRD